MQDFPPQFILWKSVPDMPPKKPRKVPCNAQGANIDPHDPNGFMTFDQASQLALQNGLNVGFVLTDNDPFFLLDLDDCWDEANQCWDQWSQGVCSYFNGAAMEVSFSRTGLHVMGKCDASQFENVKHKFGPGNRGEFYHNARFVALGHGFNGNSLQTDWTQQLLQVVPFKEVGNDAEYSRTGPVAEYTGPADDEELIQMMLTSKGSTAVQFGDKASFADLWTADADKLSRFFTSPSGDDFDHSSADAALMAHLAFWTGKDFERMDRLFRRSALMRPKWDRRSDGSSSDYRFTTLDGAIRACQNVYTISNNQSENEQRRQSAAIASGELLTVMEQQTYFEGCVYVANLNAIMTPQGSFMKRDVFSAWYGGKKFIMTGDGTKPTDNAFDAFTKNQVTKGKQVQSTTFRADLDYQEIVTDSRGRDQVNVYRPKNIKTIAGDPAPFLKLVSLLLPDERDRQILLSYMAAVVQNPGVKFFWAPVVIGTQGNGKSTLINVLQYAVDGVIHGINDDQTEYVLTMTARDLDNRFNGPMAHKTLCVIHEMHSEAGSYKDERAREDHIKSLITEPVISIERKGVDQQVMRNVANFFFCSNHMDAVRIDDNERRFAPLVTAQKSRTDMMMHGMTSEYFAELWKWLRADGFAIVAHFLNNMTIHPEFNPAGNASKAPKTSTTNQIVWESRTSNEQLILNAIADNEQGFRDGKISSLAIKRLIEEDSGGKSPSGKTLSAIMTSLGYRYSVRLTGNVMQEGGRPTIYTMADEGMTSAEYMKSQGYGETPNVGNMGK